MATKLNNTDFSSSDKRVEPTMTKDERGKPRPPLLGDGSIVGDYTLLYNYWEALRRKGGNIDDAVLKREDFDLLRDLVERHQSITLDRILDALTGEILKRIDREAAREAARETYGVELDAETAARRVARIIAGWLVEAGKNTGMLKLRGHSLPQD